MRWVAFGILLYVAAVLQTAVVPFVAVHGIRPNLLVILAVYYALGARSQDAMLACWTIGLVTDLASHSVGGHSNVGLHALALGLIAVGIVRVREYTFRNSVVTHLVFTFGSTLLLSLATGVHVFWIRDDWSRPGGLFWSAMYTAIYTSVLAPYGHWCLHRSRNLLGIGPTGRLRVR